MRFLPLVWAGIWRKPVRTCLTLFALAMAFLLFAMLQGIGVGLDQLLERSRNDRLTVVPRFGTPLPMAYKDQIAQIPGVVAIAGQQNFNGYFRDPKFVFGFGAGGEEMLRIETEFKVSPEQLAAFRADRRNMIISPRVARDMQIAVGDPFPIKSSIAKMDGTTDWAFNVVAMVDDPQMPGAIPFILAHFDYVNEERAEGKNVFSSLRLIVDDPERAVDVAKAIDAMFINSAAPTRTFIEREVFENGNANQAWIRLMIIGVVSATLFSLLLLTSNTMIQAFRERTAELAVMKTIGFTDRHVFTVLVGESLAQCLTGAAIGLVITPLALPYVKAAQPFGFAAFIQVPAGLVVIGLGIAVIVALISSAVPVARAARLTIIDALATRR
ncbi:MAG: ABC transporter permease [Rhodospirillaceae bacterium]